MLVKIMAGDLDAFGRRESLLSVASHLPRVAWGGENDGELRTDPPLITTLIRRITSTQWDNVYRELQPFPLRSSPTLG